MCLCHHALQFSTDQDAVMLCSWEGNRRLGKTQQLLLVAKMRLWWVVGGGTLQVLQRLQAGLQSSAVQLINVLRRG